jgi:hypothetical protein
LNVVEQIGNDGMQLPRSREAFACARRRLAEVADRAFNTTWREDQIPYLLDLADGVTRMINNETDGRRTAVFGMWWASQDRSAQQAIHEMRIAELKMLESRTHAGARSWTNVQAADYPNLRVNDGDTVTKFTWIFVGGEFQGQEVLPTLCAYLDHTERLIEEAERKLGP